MFTYTPKKDISIFRFAIPFMKDSIERHDIFITINKTDNKEKNVSEGKLIHISTLSLECMLKAILLLSFYNQSNDGKIIKWLTGKKKGHKLKNLLDQIQSKYDIGLSTEQKELIKKWGHNGISYRYGIDSFFNLVQTKGINSDKLRNLHKGKEEFNKDIQNYLIIYKKLYDLSKKIINEEYGVPLEIIEKGTIQIPDCQFDIMKDIYQ